MGQAASCWCVMMMMGWGRGGEGVQGRVPFCVPQLPCVTRGADMPDLCRGLRVSACAGSV